MEEQELLELAKKQENWNDDLFQKFSDLSGEEQARIGNQLQELGLYNDFHHVVVAWINRRYNPNALLTSFDDIEEKEAEFLFPTYIPMRSIIAMAGDGGTGKTFIECNLAAAVSNGSLPFMIQDSIFPRDWYKGEPAKVCIFSGEDPAEYVLKSRLRISHANMKNVLTLQQQDKRFKDLTYNGTLLEQIIDANKPSLCIFDPVQSFLPINVHMSERNAIRQCLQPLIGYGEKYGTTFLLVMHTNKRGGVYGRNRMADSADLWDISRSVLIVGESEDGQRYLSHEKSNYGERGQTAMFSLDGSGVHFESYTSKRDKEFVLERSSGSVAPARMEAEGIIIELLEKGEIPVKELEERAQAKGATATAIRRAKDALKQSGRIKYRSEGYGSSKRYFVSLLP